MTAARPMTAAPSAVDDQIERANATGVYSSFATNRRQERDGGDGSGLRNGCHAASYPACRVPPRHRGGT